MSDEENSHDDVPRKSIERREYYEEMIARKRLEHHVIMTKKFCKAKKKYLQLQKKIQQVEQIQKKESLGPQWYQELSEKQTNILDGLKDCMREDYDSGTIKSTRRTLKALGVPSFIPHVVIMDALIDSQLYPIPFLTAIKNYVIQKNVKAEYQTTIATNTEQQTKLYTPEERILMSSIFYLAFPSLIKKLDYCLKEPVPYKKIEFIQLQKPKPKSSKYESPYLEPLPAPTQPWTEVEKIREHNVRAKAQKIRENLKASEKENLQQIEDLLEKDISMKMNVTYPEHPLKKMFYNPPLLEDFKPEDTPLKTIEKTRNTTLSLNVDTSPPPKPFEPVPSETPAIKNDSVNNGNYSPAAEHTAVAVGADQPGYGDVDDPADESSDQLPVRWPYGWLKAVSAKSRVSLGSSVDSLPDSTTDENTNRTKVIVDLDGSSDGGSLTSVHHECPSTAGYDNMMNRVEEVPENPENTENPESDDDDETLAGCSRLVRDATLKPLSMLERGYMWMFSKHEGNYQDTSIVTFDTNVTVNNIRRFDPKTMSTTTLPRTPIMSKERDHDEDGDGYDYVGYDGDGYVDDGDGYNEDGDHEEAVLLREKTSLYQMPQKGHVTGNHASPVSSSDDRTTSADRSASTEEQQQLELDEDDSIHLDKVLADFHQLPPWKQLKAVLKFLSILGDPIADFPELPEVHKLKRWYELRLNINRYMTPNMKKNMMFKSTAAWNMMKPKLTSLSVPQNPMISHKNGKQVKVTWDQISETKQAIKKTKDGYMTKLKRLAVDSAREKYPTTHNEYFQTRLNRNFKRIFYDYFPSKEDDCLFECATNTEKLKKNNNR